MLSDLCKLLGAPFAPRKYAKGTRSARRLAFIFYKQAAPWIPRSLLGISDLKSLGLGGEMGKTDKLYSCQWVHCLKKKSISKHQKTILFLLLFFSLASLQGVLHPPIGFQAADIGM